MTDKLFEIENLSVAFNQNTPAVNGISFDIRRGETLALVGESGSGKSVTALSLLRLLPPLQARYPSGRVLYNGRNMLELSEAELRQIRGNRVGFIFQEPTLKQR